jgi:hypothetical protein
MRWRLVGFATGVSLLLAPSSVNIVDCEPAGYAEVAETPYYEPVHSFASVIAAAREIDHRLLLCGDASMRPIAGRSR